MRKFVQLFVLLLLPAGLYAQSGDQPRGSVRGTVTDAATHEGVPFAQVIVHGTSIGAIADSAGHFRIERVPAGYRSLQVASVGYREQITPSFLVTVAQESRRRKNDYWHSPETINFDSEAFPTWWGLPSDQDQGGEFEIEYFRYWTDPKSMDELTIFKNDM